jgi:leader peptidase (prepilin peptidase)/N-methyltransferase
MQSNMTLFVLQAFPVFIFFLAGLCIGSFLNVCIFRLPAGLSIIKPASRCPRCKKPLKWRDNIPLLGYLFLRGRCRFCRKSISWQYPAVEALTGFYFALAFLHFQTDPLRLVWALCLGAFCILLSVIDIRTMTLPDSIVLPGMALFGFTAYLNPWLGNGWQERAETMLTGFLVGGGVLYGMGWLGTFILKKDALGGGDIKLMAALGMALGWDRAMGGLFIGSILSGLLGLSLQVTGRLSPQSPMPYGPFLCAGCLAVLFYPPFGFAYWLGIR